MENLILVKEIRYVEYFLEMGMCVGANLFEGEKDAKIIEALESMGSHQGQPENALSQKKYLLVQKFIIAKNIRHVECSLQMAMFVSEYLFEVEKGVNIIKAGGYQGLHVNDSQRMFNGIIRYMRFSLEMGILMNTG